MENNPLQQDIDNIRRMQKAAEKVVSESKDVKEGKSTPEEEKQEPGFILYNKISESVVQIMERPEVAKGFVQIGKVLGPEVTRTLVNLLAICTVTGAHNAIVFYDELLKKEITEHLRGLSGKINDASADIEAFRSVLEVYKKRLSEMEKKLQVDQIKKDINE